MLTHSGLKDHGRHFGSTDVSCFLLRRRGTLTLRARASRVFPLKTTIFEACMTHQFKKSREQIHTMTKYNILVNLKQNMIFFADLFVEILTGNSHKRYSYIQIYIVNL